MTDLLIARIEELEKRVAALEETKETKKNDRLQSAYQRYRKKIGKQRRKDSLYDVDIQCCDFGPAKIKSYEEWLSEKSNTKH